MYARYAEICIDRALKSNQLIKINQELVRKNNKLLTSIKKSKELDIIKNKFVSYVSHELKTPLSTILSSTYLIGVYDKAEHQITRKKHLKRIESCVLHLTDVVDNFLSAKTEHFYSNSLDLNVPNYINQIMDEIKVLCANNQEICYKHVGENIVQINKMIFKNIIYNLLSNAIKYSATTIFISSNIVEEKIKIKVVDFGIGIPENEKSKVFNRFYRAKNVGSIDGTGLGLYISKNLIKQLNGKINVRSKVNEGTTFYVSIPYNGSK
jgi:signal transduction histidine kinase